MDCRSINNRNGKRRLVIGGTKVLILGYSYKGKLWRS